MVGSATPSSSSLEVYNSGDVFIRKPHKASKVLKRLKKLWTRRDGSSTPASPLLRHKAPRIMMADVTLTPDGVANGVAFDKVHYLGSVVVPYVPKAGAENRRYATEACVQMMDQTVTSSNQPVEGVLSISTTHFKFVCTPSIQSHETCPKPLLGLDHKTAHIACATGCVPHKTNTHLFCFSVLGKRDSVCHCFWSEETSHAVLARAAQMAFQALLHSQPADEDGNQAAELPEDDETYDEYNFDDSDDDDYIEIADVCYSDSQA